MGTDLRLVELRMSLLSLPIQPGGRVVAEVEDSEYRGRFTTGPASQEQSERHKTHQAYLRGFSARSTITTSSAVLREEVIFTTASPTNRRHLMISYFFCKVLNIK